MTTKTVSALLLPFAVALACASPDDERPSKPSQDLTKRDEGTGKAEAWGANDNPSSFGAGLQFHISHLPRSGQAQNIPWASSYWPVYQDALNHRWEGAGTESPAAKYGRAFSVAGVEDAVSLHHGIDGQAGRTACTSDAQCDAGAGEVCARRTGQTSGRCIPTWFGICHAWAPAAILAPEPRVPVTHNGVTFKVNDLKALVSLVYDRTNTRFVSLRCNKDNESGEIRYDNYGRPSSSDPECRDSNAGTYFVLLANYLGIQKQSFVEDRTFDDEVWNQPIRGYRTPRIDVVSAAEANRLIGASGSTYQFNPNAVYFYSVQLEVDYITEAPSELDGNLASSIDTYTRTDRYELILEVNRDGHVIGGEWLNESKRNHPDFLWLPLGARDAAVAGGKITYANVKMLLDRSLQSPGAPGGGEKTFAASGSLEAGAWRHYGPFQVASGKTLTAKITGTGDADLYVRKAATPTLAAYDCRPYQSTSTESCSVVGPGATYVSVYGYATATFQLDVRYTEGAGSGGAAPPATFTHVNTSGSVAQGEMKVFALPIPAGKKVVVRTTSGTDVDLYLLMDAAPTTETYAAVGYTSSGNETVTYTAPSNGTLYLGVHGYEAGSFTLRTADQ